jgi:hypothetical protein
MLANAIQLCDANFGNLFLREGNGFRTVAIHSPPSAYTDWYERHPFVEPTKEYPHSTLARLAETKEILHIADLTKDRGYLEGYPPIVALVDGAGARTDLIVPMLKEDQLIGPSSSTARKFVLSAISRLRLSNLSPTKLSSPSRTHGYSMNCDNRCGSRPPPPTSSR